MPDRIQPTRRDFLALAAGAFVVAAVPLAGRARPRLVRRSVPAMGTVAELAAVHRDERWAQAALDAAARELLRVEGLMTRFRPDSDVGRANRLAAAGAVPVSPETAFVLERALAWAGAAEGGFDPCLALAVDLWDVKRRHAPPPPRAVQRLAGRRLYRALEVDARRGRPVVRYGERDVQVDLGGIAGGYGVDRAVAVLREWGVRDGFVNLGGDIYALGVSPEGDAWSVGVRSPADPARIVGSIALSDRAVATSGDYEQFFEHGGRRYHHILDPATGAPRVAPTHSVTVAAAACLEADAATTACFGLAPAAAGRLLAAAAPGAELVHLG